MRLLHISDLHFGHNDPQIVESLLAQIIAHAPDIVVVSGDFAQIGSRDEFVQAQAFLKRISAPVVSVPGNHDVPAYNLIRRFLAPYALYRQYIHEDIQQVYRGDNAVVIGLNSARRATFGLNWSDGAISELQLQFLRTQIENTPQGDARIVVLHHPLMHPLTKMERPQKLARNHEKVLETFADLEIDLVLSGHFHMAYSRVYRGKRNGHMVQITQSASATSTRLRGYPNAYTMFSIENRHITTNIFQYLDGIWLEGKPFQPTEDIFT